MKVAIVYDRVNKWGGAERVLLVLHEMFPNAPLFTSIHSRERAQWAEVFPEIIPSFLQRIPFAQRRHELLAPLMPAAFESHNFDNYDLVISVTSEAAKGIITGHQTKHICYCLTPTRYLWSGYDDYFNAEVLKAASGPVISYLRHWDKLAAHRPDILIAISNEVKDRINKYYNRESVLIHPPVTLTPVDKEGSGVDIKNNPEEYYLVVSRLVPYKKVDLVISAFNKLDKPLVIVGTGSQENKLRRMANRNIKFTGKLTDEELASYYRYAKALVFPQYEDFGLVSVEAQAFGAPVIAFAEGGAKDTVIEGVTGVFFESQDADDLTKAVKKFDKIKFSKRKIKSNAQRFSKENFKKEFLRLIRNA